MSTVTSSRPREELKILYDYELTNAPGKSMVALEVYYPPGGTTPPHRHAGATAVAYVLEGEFLSGMNGNPAKVYKSGENFIERPGCHHTVSDNASDTEPMRAIVVLIVDTEVLKTEKGYAALVEIGEGLCGSGGD
ncbi:RmlC-like cupin domain-containing protein [Echria macrotheca]|uniref:RmlC-like cupin domain-containing protein n=1 Tax=Echria macrotheca TaxID=438768 RepID=A0AAJ0B293_9PEZI|nr:RmlC-like cupin domain-containing protein [Echria macrotheca]